MGLLAREPAFGKRQSGPKGEGVPCSPTKAPKPSLALCGERAGRRITLEEKLAFLSRPEAYGEGKAPVSTIETHFSYVFLTAERVFKLKKPLRGEGFDFSKARLRRRNAFAELRLNRAFSPEVYLGVVALTLEKDRRLSLSGKGAPVDWLVEMVRLPAERMLDQRLGQGNWRRGDIHALADSLARFFFRARPAGIAPGRHLARLRAEARASRKAFGPCGASPLAFAANALTRQLEAFLAKQKGLFAKRARERRPVDGHGDLRPEHICLGSVPRIIDRLEFRDDLRILDPVQELSFLALECERQGAPGIGRILFNHYLARSKDKPPPALSAFYRVMAALIRARLAIRHLADPAVARPEVWRKRAADYLALAIKEARRLGRR